MDGVGGAVVVRGGWLPQGALVELLLTPVAGSSVRRDGEEATLLLRSFIHGAAQSSVTSSRDLLDIVGSSRFLAVGAVSRQSKPRPALLFIRLNAQDVAEDIYSSSYAKYVVAAAIALDFLSSVSPRLPR